MQITPVLPSQNIVRDIDWYKKHLGFDLVGNDKMYAILKRENLRIHLQWHADTPDDPLLGGSVIKIFVDDIHPFYNELLERQTIVSSQLKMSTSWATNEFGFYDLNKNAIFIVQDL